MSALTGPQQLIECLRGNQLIPAKYIKGSRE